MYQISDIIEEDEPSSILHSQIEESTDILISKNLLPPARDPLPRLEYNYPNSLLPMLPLPAFVGTIPEYQPLLAAPLPEQNIKTLKSIWIGTAFKNIVYKRYSQQSYKIAEGREENWNIWTCDVSILVERGEQSKKVRQSLSSYYSPKNITDTTLVFQSRFQSGNLSLASSVSENEYNLLLQNDINTNGYTQWFFFRVSNTRSNRKTKFNILNMYKNNSLYSQGMQITVYSSKKSLNSNLSWHKDGQDIQYFENIYSKSSESNKRYYTLTWTYRFEYDEDEVYFAYNYPYTYTNLNSTLRKIETDSDCNKFFKRSLLCRTFAGNRVDVITISEKTQVKKQKKVIVISARIHPGETVSSFVFEGILKHLLSPAAEILRKNFVFKMIPMINPDGVIHGNYRTNLSGKDMNRYWEDPSKTLLPEIYHFKRLILELHEEHGVVLFCDLHGHSKKKNSFVYGCHNYRYPFQGKQFPFLVSKLFPGFSFKSCSFIKKQVREGSARSVLSRQLKIADVFTLQNSFCGPSYQNIHFTLAHFTNLGIQFCEALILYFKPLIRQRNIEYKLQTDGNLLSDDNLQSSEDRQVHLEQLYLNKSMLLQRVNSENSQGSSQEDEDENILEKGKAKKYYQEDEMHGKRKSVPVLSKHTMKSTTQLKLNFTKRDSEPNFQTQRKSLQIKKKSSKLRLKLSEKQKSEMMKNSARFKIQNFKKIEPKLFEADQFFPSDCFPNFKAREKTIDKTKTHKSHSPTKQHSERKSIELKIMTANNSNSMMNILRNNYLSVLLSTPMQIQDSLKQSLEPRQIVSRESNQRYSSEFRVRQKKFNSTDRLKAFEQLTEGSNSYKNVLNSLKESRNK